MKILLVDDNCDITETLQAALEQNFNCIVAHNGRDASEILATRHIDLVISDINFPGGGGERILAEAGCKMIPVIIFSGNNDLEIYKELGAKKTFKKPLDMESLINEVENFR